MTFIKNIALFVLVALFTVTDSSAQELTFTRDSLKKQVVFVGEVHSIKNLWDVKYRLFEYAYINCNINDIIIEESKSNAYIYNLFLRTRDVTLLGNDSAFNAYIKGISRLSEDYKRPVKFHGVDFERIEIVLVLRYIFEHAANGTCKQTALYQYLASMPEDKLADLGGGNIYDAKTRHGIKEVVATIKEIFSSEKGKLTGVLANDYADVEDIINNPTTVNFKTRDRNMLANMMNDKSLDKNRFICFVGRFHINTQHENPLCSRYISAYNNAEKVATISLICPSCSRKFPYSGLPKNYFKSADNAALTEKYKSVDKYNVVSSSDVRVTDFSDYIYRTDMYYMFF